MATMKAEVTVNNKTALWQSIEPRITEIYSKTIQKVIPKMMKEADFIVKSAIDAYYDAYEPKVYRRNESLYSVFKIEFSPAYGFELAFDPKYMKEGSHRVGNEYIYDVMFKKGYHGGAPHNGDYYWRFPSPQSAQALGVPAFITWYPFGPAAQSESPWERIQIEWGDYTNGSGKKLFLDTLCSEFKKVIKEVS